MRICLPPDYMKFELPQDETTNVVSIGVDIKDIPKVRRTHGLCIHVKLI